jgi:transposase
MPSLEKCKPLVEELYNRGVPVKEIAKRCGNSMSTVYKALERLEAEGKVRRRKGRYRRHKRLTSEEIEEIRQLYESGRTIYEIAKMLDRPVSTIYYALKRLGLK